MIYATYSASNASAFPNGLATAARLAVVHQSAKSTDAGYPTKELGWLWYTSQPSQQMQAIRQRNLLK